MAELGLTLDRRSAPPLIGQRRAEVNPQDGQCSPKRTFETATLCSFEGEITATLGRWSDADLMRRIARNEIRHSDGFVSRATAPYPAGPDDPAAIAAHIAQPRAEGFGERDHALLFLVDAGGMNTQRPEFLVDLGGHDLGCTVFRGVLQVQTQGVQQVIPAVPALESPRRQCRQRRRHVGVGQRLNAEDQRVAGAQLCFEFGTQWVLLFVGAPST